MQSWGVGLADSPGSVWRRACVALPDRSGRYSSHLLSDARLLWPPNSKRWQRWLIFDWGRFEFVDWLGGEPSVGGVFFFDGVFQLPISQSGWYRHSSPVSLAVWNRKIRYQACQTKSSYRTRWLLALCHELEISGDRGWGLIWALI